VRHSAVALRGAQVNSSSAQSDLLLVRSNQRHRGSFACSPTGLSMQVSTSLRPLCGILAESTGVCRQNLLDKLVMDLRENVAHQS
jgi:hypothetical protein